VSHDGRLAEAFDEMFSGFAQETRFAANLINLNMHFDPCLGRAQHDPASHGSSLKKARFRFAHSHNQLFLSELNFKIPRPVTAPHFCRIRRARSES
jgi:hypothetical protein